MAKSPVRHIIIKPGNQGPPLAEATILSFWVRLLRCLRWVVVLIVVLSAYGVGVLTGTSGQFADGVAELRRFTHSEPGDDGTVAVLLETIGRLDATDGIDATKTRHGVGATIADLETICREELEIVRDATARLVARALQDIRGDIARAQLANNTRFDGLEATTESTGVLAADAGLDCKSSHELFGDMLGLLPAASTDSAVGN